MSKKTFSVFGLLIILSMIIMPVSAKQNLFGAGVNRTGGNTSAAGLPVDQPGAPVYGTESATGIFVVRLLDAPLASYKGGIPGLAATSPSVTGAVRLDTGTQASQAYTAYLDGKHQAFVSDMESLLGRSVDVEFRYTNAMNGLAVFMSLAEAQQVANLSGVTAVYADTLRELTTDVGPHLINADAIWNGATTTGLSTQGEGVIIGVIDTGINSLHPAFADIGGDGYDHTNPNGSGNYFGVCDPNDPVYDPTFTCNDKLIGAYDLNGGGDTTPEDVNGHGSHTASTAGGNRHDAVFMVNLDEYTVEIQGVSPHSNIIAYEICEPSCPSSSAVEAVDLAIAQGVAVLNYSISGTDNPWVDTVDLAFLEAFNAGIFVSASAGNDGPGASTVAKTGPWNAAVAASTHKRVIAQTFDVVSPAPPADLIGLAAVPGENVAIGTDITAEITYHPANLDGCVAFPASYFDGKIALIQRGTCTFTVKVANADAAGAIAVVVFNNVGGPPISMGATPADPPSVFLDLSDGTAVKDYIDANAPVTARINVETAYIENEEWEDIVAGFSSRGPSDFDILKPDYSAPGVNILAAVQADGSNAVTYGFLQGTSMSSPHGAGSAALMVALHPDWSPAQIKSALSSSADPNMLDSDGVTPADPFDTGSGRLDLEGAGSVGFVFDETYDNFVAANPAIGGDPKTLNVPALQDWNCAATCTFTRTIESVLPLDVTYDVSYDAPAGVTVTVSPDGFELGAGEVLEIEITIDVSSAPADTWQFGNIWFLPQWYTLYIPIVSHDTSADALSGGGDDTVFNGPSAQHIPFALQNVPAEPDIDVDPTELNSSQAPNTQVDVDLTISNVGSGTLNWDIDEDNSPGSPVFTPPAGATGGSGTGLLGQAESGVELPAGYQPFSYSGAGTVLLDQAPNAINGFFSDETCPLCGTGQQSIAENFVLAEDATVEEIVFWGGYFPSNTPAPDDITVIFHNDSAGLPGSVVYSESGIATVRVSTGVVLFGVNEYMYTLTPATPVDLPAGTYYVEIFNNVAPDNFFWETGNLDGVNGAAGSSFAFETPGVSWNFDATNNLSIQLIGSTTGDVSCDAPEDIPWLSLSPTSGSTGGGDSDTVTATFDSTGLGAGDYTAVVCVNSDDPDESLVVVPATLTVGTDPDIDVDPASLSSTQETNTVLTQTLTIANTGVGDLIWDIDEDNSPASWIAGISMPSGAVTNPGITTSGASPHGFTAPTGGVLYDQTDNAGTNAITSQEFEAGFATFTNQAADDFVVTDASGWTVDQVFVTGAYFNGVGPTPFVNVEFYADAGGAPGALAKSYDGIASFTDNGLGTLTIDLSADPAVLAMGTYWVSVAADMDFGAGGQWGWTERTVQSNTASMWQNPGDGFASGCTTWMDRLGCGVGDFPDLIFSLSGTVGGGGGGSCDAPEDIPWLSLDPTSGTTGGGGSDDVTVTFDSTGLAVGTYEADLCVNSNDPDEDPVVVPVTLEVAAGAGGWSDDFDSYATDQDLHGVGGWKGWDNSPGASASTSDDQAQSSPNSVAILGGADLVHEYTETSGVWVYTAWQYIPSSFAGTTYFILLNTYADGGPNNWSVQVQFNSATGMMTNDGVSGGTMAYLEDQWVEIRVEIDLDADTQSFYYNNVLLFTGTWSDELSGGGATSIGAVDLFASGASVVYYDDMSLVFVP